MNESRTLAEFIVNTRYEDIPPAAIQVQKKALLDAIAVTLAASTLGEGCKEFVELAVETGGKPESTILGFGAKVPAMMAAFANAAMAHSLDFEDSHDRALVHSNAAAVPAALAVAEAVGSVSGKELIAALTLGSDLVCRMGLALNEDLLKYGWYMPPVLEAFGATAAVGRLLGLTPEQMLDALSLTLCQATCSSELVNSPQSQIRSVRDAFSAKAAVLSAQLAKKGIKGFAQPLEGKLGFYTAYAKGNYTPSQLTDELGQRFESVAISFKPWPSCRGTHPYIDAVLQLVRKHHLQAEDVEKVHVVVSPVNKMLCEPAQLKMRPTTPINAKFSIPFLVATALVHHGVTLDHFTDRALAHEKVLALAEKVSYEVDANLTKEETLHGVTVLYTKKGILTCKVTSPYGSTENPISEKDLLGKLQSCAKFAVKPMPEKNLLNLAEMVMSLEKREKAHEIMACL